jgi:DNA (cytosine-5)-methyltransferase 1
VRAATLFSGIGAPEGAMPGWRWRGHAESEPFPSAGMAARHPGSINLGDVTAPDFVEQALDAGRPDIVVFGSPCQSFSVAGKRLGLADPRGNLALTALALVQRIRPRWICFENVPGLLSSDKGRDFDAFLSTVAECGYLGCWRVLDAKFTGVPQRRRRIFFVGYLGDWRPAAAVLSLLEGMSGHPAQGDEAGQEVAGSLGAGSRRSGGRVGRREAAAGHVVGATVGSYGGGLGELSDISPSLQASGGEDQRGIRNPLVMAFGGNNTAGPIDSATACNAHGGPHGRLDFESETFVVAPPITGNPYGDHESREGLLVTHSLRADGFDASEESTGRGTPLVPVACIKGAAIGREPHNGPQFGEVLTDGTSFTLNTIDRHATAFSCKDSGLDADDLAPTLRAMPHGGSHANAGGQVAVAMNLRGRAGGAMPECDDLASVRAASGGSSRSYVATGKTYQGDRLIGEDDVWPTLPSQTANNGGGGGGAIYGPAVRRLTPRECERLQGFPDDFTAISYRGKPAADGPRYRSLGNSMAVPCIRWILERVERCDAAQRSAAA